jgi:hypothetical protein
MATYLLSKPARNTRPPRTQGAHERGVQAEKEGRYLLASTCYYNALTMYPGTPVAEKARVAVDRVDNLLQNTAISQKRPISKERD